MHEILAGETTADETLFTVGTPVPLPGANQRLLLGLGAPLAPIDRLRTFSDKQFENFVHEWIHGYLHEEYCEVQRVGGSSDKGRDVIAWVDKKDQPNRKWDSYQCKLYKEKISATNVWIELGKLIFFTYTKAYSVPRRYCIVTREGITTNLNDLINDPNKLKSGLADNWTAACANKITSKKEVPLDGNLKAYIDAFDFSIVSAVPPLTLIDQHRKTPYHAATFGAAFLKPRPKPKKPSPEIAPHEARYVKKILDAYAEHTNRTVRTISDVKQRSDLVKQFQHCRESFYSAESLKEFARDALPDGGYFEDLENQFLDGVTITLNKLHSDGYSKMVETCQHATNLQITAHPLGSELRPLDRVGICHHLANNDRLTWASAEQ